MITCHCGHVHTRRYCGALIPRDDGAGPDTCVCDEEWMESRDWTAADEAQDFAMKWREFWNADYPFRNRLP